VGRLWDRRKVLIEFNIPQRLVINERFAYRVNPPDILFQILLPCIGCRTWFEFPC
jgi:hypothetical protein